MRSSRVAIVLMLGLGLALAVGNLWTAVVRSTIPCELKGKITDTEIRFEKHKGKDDVHLICLGEKSIQVDKAVFQSVQKNSSIEKESFSRNITVDGQPVGLEFSRDATGMLPAMMLVIVLLGATGWYAGRLIELEASHSLQPEHLIESIPRQDL